MSMVSGRGTESADSRNEAGPHPVDRHVGLRIRMRRKEQGISQERLAEALGLTFQQVQKYERAANRVSASKLFEIARALNASVGYFYIGLDGSEGMDLDSGSDLEAQAFLQTPDGAELASLFPKVSRGRLRRKLLDLVRAIAENENESGGEAPRRVSCEA